MVGVLSSVVVDCHTYRCLCVDAMPSISVNLNKHLVRRGGTMELSSSFVEPVREWRRLCVNRSFKNKQRRVPIVNELGGQYDDTFDDVKTQILNYFTYKAVRTVLLQLYEMNPPQYRLLYNFVTTNNPTEGKRFIRSLAKEQQGLAERVMVTRLHLYGKWAKKCNHGEIYKEISDENLELMRERLMETVIWPSDDTNTEKVG
ncbi:putative chaperonin-like RbcX [Lupinus albus]|uniref:Putative chaperonin-like RbcX n=1 Tax=Lupinus albus TaxID=3870 RepID=A0A6A4QJR9_LUPAL|nr:putative chaperonin-like RbcX [Lupinus albus]KAE9614715.1 putative chaperonin-like RbcX [Lupinus albus]